MSTICHTMKTTCRSTAQWCFPQPQLWFWCWKKDNWADSERVLCHHKLGVQSRLRFVGSESYWGGGQPLYPPNLGQRILVPRWQIHGVTGSQTSTMDGHTTRRWVFFFRPTPYGFRKSQLDRYIVLFPCHVPKNKNRNTKNQKQKQHKTQTQAKANHTKTNKKHTTTQQWQDRFQLWVKKNCWGKRW